MIGRRDGSARGAAGRNSAAQPPPDLPISSSSPTFDGVISRNLAQVRGELLAAKKLAALRLLGGVTNDGGVLFASSETLPHWIVHCAFLTALGHAPPSLPPLARDPTSLDRTLRLPYRPWPRPSLLTALGPRPYLTGSYIAPPYTALGHAPPSLPPFATW